MARSRKSLIKEADRVFSLHIRNRGQNFGYNHCFTCGSYLPVEELQAGHFIPRRFINTRWHIVNVWPQCNRCNVELGGNIGRYKDKLASLFGQDAVDGLWIVARNGVMTDGEIAAIIKTYK